MAIDDNTSYELTGAQVKDLANKIKAKAADNIFVGATSAIPGSKGLVPAPQAGDDTKFLSGDGTWKTAGGGGTTYTAGAHIDITGNVISAEDYISADSPTAAVTPSSPITTSMIANGAVTSAKIATGVVPVITMTDTDPGEGSPLADNNFIAVYGDDPNSMDYSLVEANTGATWIDGSPIYKKTINFGALPNATSKRVAHGISNLDLIIKTEGYSKDSYNIHRAVPYTHMGSSLGGSVMDIESSDIVIYTDSDRSGLTAYVTLYYTKSS